MGTMKDSEKTKTRLIDSAGRLFAEKGFSAVTVREIAAAADTHLSALNYHFNSKAALYREVLLAACRSEAISSEDKKALLKMDPKKALFLIIQESLKTYAQKDDYPWQTLLLTRECKTPSQEFEEIVETYIRPETDFTAQLIGKAVGKPGNDHSVKLAVLAMIGLIETFGLYDHLLEAVSPGFKDHFAQKDALAQKILDLVLEAAD